MLDVMGIIKGIGISYISKYVSEKDFSIAIVSPECTSTVAVELTSLSSPCLSVKLRSS